MLQYRKNWIGLGTSIQATHWLYLEELLFVRVWLVYMFELCYFMFGIGTVRLLPNRKIKWSLMTQLI